MAKPKRMERYWWFQGAPVEKVLQDLLAAGPNARLEAHPDGDELTLWVIPADPAVLEGGGTNESHICPPVCS